MKIIISPFSQKLRNGKENPKNYPFEYWSDVVDVLQKDHEIIQVGVKGEPQLVPEFYTNLKMKALKEILDGADTFISVDNFFPHFAHHYGKRGIVIFSRSNPEIYGYPENINLLKSREHLRPDQFGLWESVLYIKDAFIDPKEVVQHIN